MLKTHIRFILGAIITVITFSSPVWAASQNQAQNAYQNFRFSFKIGGNWANYTGENKVTADAGRGISATIHYDVDLGAYFSWLQADQRTSLGLLVDYMTDNWWHQPQSVNITQSFLAFDATHFFRDRARKGFFVRADAGVVEFINSQAIVSGRSRQGTTVTSPLGLGVQAGTGYAFQLGKRVSFLTAFDGGYRWAGRSTATELTLSLGFLF